MALSYQHTQSHLVAYHDGFIDSSKLEDLKKLQVVGSLHSAEQRRVLTPGTSHSIEPTQSVLNLRKALLRGIGSGVMMDEAVRVAARNCASST